MENKTIKLKINGKEITCEPGKTILEASRENGFEIPTLCHDPRLSPYGSCLLCVVEIKGQPKLAISCATEVREGIEVTTDNERIFKARKTALEMLLSNHFADCRGPCWDACPANVDVQGYLAFANLGKYKEALELIRETNPLPMICGRVCVRYCEVNCRRNDVDSPVAINFIKRYTTDLEYDNLEKANPPPKNGHKVAIIGGGPAGLTCAYFLARKGYGVKIFEAHPKLGGMVRYGIPDYRLPQNLLDKEINYILSWGVDVQTNVRLGKDFTLDNLKKEGFEAVFLALGSQLGKKMRVENEEVPGVWTGVAYLEKVKKEGAPDFSGTHVVVVGGGNTAIDASRTALRCNAKKVSILYRRTREEMPADHVEIEDAIAEGVDIRYLVAPTKVLPGTGGKVKGIECLEMELGEPDESGRRRPVPKKGSEYVVDCDYIISAIGQDSELKGLENTQWGKVETTKWATIVTDEKSFATSAKGIFCGGDVMTGPKAAIDAIGHGRKTAMVIDKFLQTGSILPASVDFVSKRTAVAELGESFLAKFQKLDRSKMQQRAEKERIKDFDEADLGIAPNNVKHETNRCLSCGCSDVFICDLKKFSGDYNTDQTAYKGKAKKYESDERHPFVALDANKCVQCSKCIRTCDEIVGASALGFVNRGVEMVMRPAMNKPLAETTCVSCGNCIESCPTGAVTFKSMFEKPGPWKTTSAESICSYCSVGCELVYNITDRNIFYITAKKPAPYTEGELCAHGRFGHDYLTSEKRITKPLVKGKAADLAQSISSAAKELKKITDKHGPESVAFFVSPKVTNEEAYLAQKIARYGLGSNNVISASDFSRDFINNILGDILGATTSTVTQEALKKADVVIVANGNISETNPVLSFRVHQAARRGATVVVASPVDNKLKRDAAIWLNTKRGTVYALFAGVAKEILDKGWENGEFIKGRTENLDEFKNSLSKAKLNAEELSGAQQNKISELAKLISAKEGKVVVIYDLDDLANRTSEDLKAIAQTLLLAGKLGAKESGILIPRIHSNYAGIKDLGCGLCVVDAIPALKADSSKFAGAKSKEELRKLISSGKIKGVVSIGEDLSVNPELKTLLEKTELTVAFDLLETETTKKAGVVIPLSAIAESEGSTTSFERKVHAFAKAFEPASGKTGFEALSMLLAELTGKKAASIADVRKEIAGFNPRYAKLAGLKAGESFYWNEGEGGKTLFEKAFLTKSGKAHFVTFELPKSTTSFAKLLPHSIEQHFESRISTLFPE